MKNWNKDKMIMIIAFIVALIFVMGIFIGRISANNIYYIG